MSGAGRAADRVGDGAASPSVELEADSTPAGSDGLAKAAPGARLNAAAVLALQQTAGNRLTTEAVAGWIPRLLGRVERVLARQRVQTLSGRYVGDLEGAEANVREDVLAVMDALHSLWSMPNSDYANEYPSVRWRPANERLHATDIPLTIQALHRNNEKSITQAVAQAHLGVTIAAAVADTGSNSKSDVLALQDGLHATWNLTTPRTRASAPPSSRAAIRSTTGRSPRRSRGSLGSKPPSPAGRHDAAARSGERTSRRPPRTRRETRRSSRPDPRP